MSDSPIQTCERCQMKLHENLGTFTPSVRGSMAWRCAACLPIEGPSGRLMREHIVMLRKARFGFVAPPAPVEPPPARKAQE